MVYRTADSLGSADASDAKRRIQPLLQDLQGILTNMLADPELETAYEFLGRATGIVPHATHGAEAMVLVNVIRIPCFGRRMTIGRASII
jgi:hypothetical protein